jgi:hypothetical protein
MGQMPFVSQTCIATEISVTSVFSRSTSTTINIGGDTGLAGRGQLQFKLGL